MNKQEWTWLSIRVFGLYMIVEAVKALPGVLSGLYRMAISFSIPIIKGQENLSGQIGDALKAVLVSSVLQLVIYTIAGVYLLRGGVFLFKLICPSNEQEHPSKNP
jgi:hypothetical protein